MKFLQKVVHFLSFLQKKTESEERRVKNRLPWHTFLGGMDLEIVGAGFGEGIRVWRYHPSFGGDNFFRLYFPVKGKFRLLFAETHCTVEPGFIFLLPAGTPFSYESVTPSNHWWIHFISRQLRTLPAMKQPIRLPVENAALLSSFRSVVRGISGIRTLSDDLEIRNRVFLLLAPFLEHVLQNTPPEVAAKGCFSEVLEYIDRHLSGRIDAETLRSMTPLSRSAFSALFRQTFGLPPKQYLSLRRISRAKQLLWRTSLSVKEIAEQCGYENATLFFRMFKKFTGKTPGEYRDCGLSD